MAKAAGALVNVADRPNISDFIMPSIVDRSPLVIAVSTGGASPILGRMLKARLETLIPAAYGRLADLMSGFRGRVAAAISDPTMRRRFWETVLEGPIAEAALASNEEAAGGASRARDRALGRRNAPRQRARSISSARDRATRTSLTFRALRLMQKADVVLYDRLTDERVMNLVRREAERIYVGKRPDNHEVPQEEISALLVRLAKQGRRVLRLKGGDPFMFGRGGEEIETLAEHGVPFQVCPGVTAAIGASAYAGIPLTHRDHAQACVFVTGHGKDGQDRPRLAGAAAAAADRRHLHGAAQPRGADGRVHRPRREPRPAGGDRRQRHAPQPARRRRHARHARREGARRRTYAARRSSSSGRWCRCAASSTGTRLSPPTRPEAPDEAKRRRFRRISRCDAIDNWRDDIFMYANKRRSVFRLISAGFEGGRACRPANQPTPNR